MRRRVSEALEVGICWVNCSQPCFCQAPWGGVKDSGFGRELGTFGLDSFLSVKQVGGRGGGAGGIWCGGRQPSAWLARCLPASQRVRLPLLPSPSLPPPTAAPPAPPDHHLRVTQQVGLVPGAPALAPPVKRATGRCVT